MHFAFAQGARQAAATNYVLLAKEYSNWNITPPPSFYLFFFFLLTKHCIVLLKT